MHTQRVKTIREPKARAPQAQEPQEPQKAPEKNTKKQKRTAPARFVRVVGGTILSVTIVCLILGISYLIGIGPFPEFNKELLENMDQTLLVFDGGGQLCANVHGGNNRIKVDIKDVPDIVKQAFVSAEDARFYEHSGVDITRIFGAIISDIKSGSLKEGASTITQQLIKTTHLTNDKNFARKLQEAYLALEVERTYTKDEILEMYLNWVYFGHGAYGIETASRTYFDKQTSELTLSEAALLAGVLKSPTRYAPHIKPEASVQRRNLILSLMEEYGYITSEQKLQACEEELNLAPEQENVERQGDYIDTAIQEASQLLGMSYDELMLSGYRIYTNLDSELQERCEEAFADDSLFPNNAADGTKVQGAMVVLDSKTAGIKALVGGRDQQVSRGLNRATSIARSPGSAIKPVLVYAPALESGYTSATLFEDAPKAFNDYAPGNFSSKYYGTVTLRQVAARSLNVPTVQLFSDLGVKKGMDFAMLDGIHFEKDDNSLALALGGFTRGVSPLTLANAYQPFANAGERTTARAITCITDAKGKALYTVNSDKRQIMDAGNAFILSDMLKSTVEWGTGTRLQIPGTPVACKTGTAGHQASGGNSDTWSCMYSPDLVACVWMGYDQTDNAHYLDAAVTGGTFPTRLMKSVMERTLPPDGRWFEQPENVVEAPVGDAVKSALLGITPANQEEDAIAAMSQEPVMEYFLSGTEPQQAYDPLNAPYGYDHTANRAILSITLSYDSKPVITLTDTDELASYKLYRVNGEQLPILLATLSGLGPPSFVDDSTEPGREYSYYYVPVVRTQDGMSTMELSASASSTIYLPGPRPGVDDLSPTPTLEDSVQMGDGIAGSAPTDDSMPLGLGGQVGGMRDQGIYDADPTPAW